LAIVIITFSEIIVLLAIVIAHHWEESNSKIYFCIDRYGNQNCAVSNSYPLLY